MSLYRLLRQIVCSGGWITSSSQTSCEVHAPRRLRLTGSKTMITYNCHGCGSWSNQYMGRTTVKGDNTKFQLVPGPSTDMNCPHCGGRQHVHTPILTLLTPSLLDRCGVVPFTTDNSSKKYRKH